MYRSLKLAGIYEKNHVKKEDLELKMEMAGRIERIFFLSSSNLDKADERREFFIDSYSINKP